MTHVTDTELHQDLSRYLDQAADSHIPVLVTRGNGKANVVVMAEEDFNGWQETAHLLSSPRNAERLLRSIRRTEAGQVEERDLLAAELPSKA